MFTFWGYFVLPILQCRSHLFIIFITISALQYQYNFWYSMKKAKYKKDKSIVILPNQNMDFIVCKKQ